MDRRTAAREIAMQALFQLDVQGDEKIETVKKFITTSTNDDLVRSLATTWTFKTWRNLEICDQLITSVAIKWQMSRLSLVDKSILRLSAYQLKFCEDIPGKVVINEAIELAKKFSTEKSSGFVNGVLDAIMKILIEEKTSHGG